MGGSGTSLPAVNAPPLPPSAPVVSTAGRAVQVQTAVLGACVSRARAGGCPIATVPRAGSAAPAALPPLVATAPLNDGVAERGDGWAAWPAAAAARGGVCQVRHPWRSLPPAAAAGSRYKSVAAARVGIPAPIQHAGGPFPRPRPPVPPGRGCAPPPCRLSAVATLASGPVARCTRRAVCSVCPPPRGGYSSHFTSPLTLARPPRSHPSLSSSLSPLLSTPPRPLSPTLLDRHVWR